VDASVKQLSPRAAQPGWRVARKRAHGGAGRRKSYAESLQALTLDNAAIWARAHARPAVPAPWLIKAPYLFLCGQLDSLFEGRPIERFWFLETVARMPYFAYVSLLHLYETLGWWRRSAGMKRVHFEEECNEFHHLLIVESLGGDQSWGTRFLAQHSAIVYYFLLVGMWLLSPTLAYNFSELLEAHAVDTYTEFLSANEQALRALPPPQVAIEYYGAKDAAAPAGAERARVATLYDVFERVRDDEAQHTESMRTCQDADIRARSKIVELGALAAVVAVVATTVVGTEGALELESAASEAVVTQLEAIEKAEGDLYGRAVAQATDDLVAASKLELER